MNKRVHRSRFQPTVARIAALIVALMVNVSFAAAIVYGGQSDMYRFLVAHASADTHRAA